MNCSSILRINSHQVYLTYNEDWSSKAPSHRELIRKAIFINDRARNFNALELSFLPLKLKSGFYSISHSPSFGGFCHCPSTPVGFDIEVSHRVSPQLISNFAASTEIESCPSPAAYWTAKEAIFKALAYQQKDQNWAYENTKITKWAHSQEWDFDFTAENRNNHSLKGAVKQVEDSCLAVAIVTSKPC